MGMPCLFCANVSVPSVGDASVQLLLLVQQPLPQRVALQHAVERLRVVPGDLLLHVQDGDVGGDAQAAIGQHLQQGGLTQPVPTYQTVAPARRQAQLRALQEGPLAEGDVKVLDADVTATVLP